MSGNRASPSTPDPYAIDRDIHALGRRANMGHHLGLSQSRNGKGKQAEQGGRSTTRLSMDLPSDLKTVEFKGFLAFGRLPANSVAN